MGIPHYWIVRMVRDNGPATSIEMLRLMSNGVYVTERAALRSHGDLMAIEASEPLDVSLTWEQLDLGID